LTDADERSDLLLSQPEGKATRRALMQFEFYDLLFKPWCIFE
jgi:hypothetical protein